jgi:hypothetical protein
MNFASFSQPSLCPCAYSNTPALENGLEALKHDADDSSHVEHLDVQTLACPTCGRLRFVIVPTEVTEMPLAS